MIRNLSFVSVLALFAFACQDPSGVGLGIIDESGGVPGTRVVEGTDIATDSTFESTAGFASTGATSPQTRVLFGEVEDDLFGDASAAAHVDFLRSASADDINASDVVQVRLQLRRSYTYGDTLATLPFEVREISDDWEPVGIPPDTSMETGSVIFASEIAAEDTVAFLDFPQDWVTANRERLLDEDFNEAFNGFQLAVPVGGAPSPGAVLGFNMARSSLDLITDEDTIRFPAWEVFTRLIREEPTNPPSGVVPLADGRAQALGVTFDLSEHENATVAGGAIRFTIDRNAIPPSGSFVRPLASQAGLFLVGSEGEAETILAVLDVPDEGVDFGLSSATFTQELQSFAVSDSLSRRFQIAFALTPTSLDVLPISLQPVLGEGGPPRLVLTLIDPE